MSYDAILLVSFGGPERTADVMPFLENVLRGRNVPRERMYQVAEHYYHFGGKSPINDQNRALIAALTHELKQHGLDLPVYWGNRNWHPMLADTMQQMKADGVQRALAFVTAAYSSYSSCRQYRENIAAAQAAAGEGSPQVDKIRAFYNHPGFVEANVAQVQSALELLPAERKRAAHIAYTAHSIPISMAQSCAYERQLLEVARLVSTAAGACARSAGVSKPQRSSFAAVAGARHSRPHTRAQATRRDRPRDRSHRICLRPHGSSLRPRHRSREPVQPVGHKDGARRDGRNASAICHHDPRVDRRENGQRWRASHCGRLPAKPGCL